MPNKIDEEILREFRKVLVKSPDYPSPGWTVPYVNSQASVVESFLLTALNNQREATARALVPWIDGNVGCSSEAIFCYMARGARPRAFDAPSDSGDRARCVVLLQVFPEWVDRLKEIEALNLKGTSNGIEVFPWNKQIPLIISLLNKTL